jgi:hypothetical protein
MMTKTMIEHRDQLNQPLTPGMTVAFVSAYSGQLRIGRVRNLCPKRIRVEFVYSWTSRVDGREEQHRIAYLARPERCLALTDTLAQELTLLRLKDLL